MRRNFHPRNAGGPILLLIESFKGNRRLRAALRTGPYYADYGRTRAIVAGPARGLDRKSSQKYGDQKTSTFPYRPVRAGSIHTTYTYSIHGGSVKIVLVPKRGLEPPRGCPHMVLNHARLPIPPFRHCLINMPQASKATQKRTRTQTKSAWLHRKYAKSTTFIRYALASEATQYTSNHTAK